jgi:hypothetical protein
MGLTSYSTTTKLGIIIPGAPGVKKTAGVKKKR